MDNRSRAAEFNVDRRPAKIRSHGEIGNGCSSSNSCRDIKENTVGARLPSRRGDDAERRQAHNGADGIIDVGTMSSNGDVSGLAVRGIAVNDYCVVDHGSGLVVFLIENEDAKMSYGLRWESFERIAIQFADPQMHVDGELKLYGTELARNRL